MFKDVWQERPKREFLEPCEEQTETLLARLWLYYNNTLTSSPAEKFDWLPKKERKKIERKLANVEKAQAFFEKSKTCKS